MSDCLREYHPAELGKDGYPVLWHLEIKHLVREEADYRCVRCGHPYPPGTAERHPKGAWTPCDGRCLHAGRCRVLVPFEGEPDTPPEWLETIALRPIGELVAESGGQEHQAWHRILTVHHLDMVKGNCRWWNLAALCQVCHLQIQNKVVMAQVYPFAHSEWMKPFAAGYYALTYLGEDLTRDQVTDRLDELLALEFQVAP